MHHEPCVLVQSAENCVRTWSLDRRRADLHVSQPIVPANVYDVTTVVLRITTYPEFHLSLAWRSVIGTPSVHDIFLLVSEDFLTSRLLLLRIVK
jgi:hypothetical protein